MRSILLIVAILIYSSASGRAADPASPASARQGPTTGLFMHGWEIQSISGIRRASVAEFRSPSANGQLGDPPPATVPAKGQYLIIQIQYSWTSSGAPTDPIWAGKPPFKLMDDQGVEYGAIGILTRRGGEYAKVDMDAIAAAAVKAVSPHQTQRALVYFDVPAQSNHLKLVVAPASQPVEIPPVGDFSTGDIDIPK